MGRARRWPLWLWAIGCFACLAVRSAASEAPQVASAPSPDPAAAAASARAFDELLRAYPQRPVPESLAQAARLSDASAPPLRARIQAWMGSALLSRGELAAAQAHFAAALAAAGGPQARGAAADRARLGLADAASQGGAYAQALALYAAAQSSGDPATRERARLSADEVRQRQRQARLGLCGAGIALLVATWLGWATFRAGGAAAAWPPPAEAVVLTPLCAAIAAAALALEPPARAAVWSLVASGLALLYLSGARLRAVPQPALMRVGQTAACLLALFGCGLFALEREGLLGSVALLFGPG